jgi:hypothetical protein
MSPKVVPLNERGAAYLRDLEERAAQIAKENELERRYVFVFGERPYSLSDFFKRKD